MVYDNDRLYNFLVHYVRWTFRLMFRSLQVCGKENIPEDAAVIYAPNHVNTLLDALATAPRRLPKRPPFRRAL